jgi:hypothetical protein
VRLPFAGAPFCCARGLNKLQFAGTLLTVWIPPADIRDMRELPRTRMVFVNLRIFRNGGILGIIQGVKWLISG